MKLIAGALLLAYGVALAQTAPTSSFVQGSAQDEAQILAILKDSSGDMPNTHMAADLDWENAFGIRYTDLKKRDTFYHKYVTPLQKDDTQTTLEVKVRFIAPDAAVADEYWHTVGQLDMNTHKPGPDRWGRTTYIFTKKAGVWTDVLERVADLRLPYYKHFDALPKAAVLPAGTLEKLAGKYQFTDDHLPITITMEGDHLLYAGPRRTYVAVPVTATEFLLFDPKDLAEYSKITFSADPAGKTMVKAETATGEMIGTLERIP